MLINIYLQPSSIDFSSYFDFQLNEILHTFICADLCVSVCVLDGASGKVRQV